MRPHVLLLIGLALALASAAPAEAGRRAHKSKKVRARAQAQTESHTRRPSAGATPSAAPSSTVAVGERTPPAAKSREKVFDFSGLELAGSERMPQLLYFLDRAEEELERASLERRSFVPEMMRSLDEEHL
jgi:hypothetical protein